MSGSIYIWEGDTYRLDIDAPSGSRVMVKENGVFVSKPGFGILGTTISFEGEKLGPADPLPDDTKSPI